MSNFSRARHVLDRERRGPSQPDRGRGGNSAPTEEEAPLSRREGAVNPHNEYEQNVDYNRFQGGYSHEGEPDNAGATNRGHGRGLRIGSPAALAAAIPNNFPLISKPRTTSGNKDVSDDPTREAGQMSTEEFKKRMHQVGPHQGGNVPYKYPKRPKTDNALPGVKMSDGPTRSEMGSVLGRRGTNSGAQAPKTSRHDYTKKHIGSKLGTKRK